MAQKVCRERVIFLVAGMLILVGLVLGVTVAQPWLLLSGFVGVNMLQASLTGFCPLTKILKACGVQPCSIGSPTA